jgi:beta-phosphoglucomutase-like phosphatase (HAD superfamily)
MTEVSLRGRFQNQEVEWLAREGVGLATLDLDNVLADFNSIEVYKGAIENIEEMKSNGTNVAIVTNCSDTERLQTIEEQLELPIFYKGLRGLRGKPSPDMLNEAAGSVSLGAAGNATAHFDDQIKAWRSAIKAQFDWFVWSMPDGGMRNSHYGVTALRPIELPMGIVAVSALNLYRTAKDIRKGDI